MGTLNLAHGALYMVAAYIGWTVTVQFGFSYFLAVLSGGLVAGLLGLAIERGFLRHLYRQINDQVLVTCGFIYILSNLSLWVWGGQAKPSFSTPIFSGSVTILGWQYPVHRLTTTVVGLVLAAVMWWVQEKTRIGAIVRAGMDDKEMTTGLGIKLDRVNEIVFFFGAFIAGIAGVIGSQMMGPNLDMAFNILLLALIVLVVGGMGSIQGAFVGAMVIGIVDAFGRALMPAFAMFLMYLAMVIILSIKPSGLMGRQ
jgi:branched-chain amino acid transport system permease protein